MCLVIIVLPNFTKAAPSKLNTKKLDSDSVSSASYTLSLLDLETVKEENKLIVKERNRLESNQTYYHHHHHRTFLTSSSTKRLRKRHSKRHSTWYDDFIYNPNTTEWSNPCGGRYDHSDFMPKRLKKRNPKKVYKTLKVAAENEYITLNGSKQSINISAIKIWWIHNKTYKFLPKLKMNSSIALKRWYRNMQTFVGAFAYLGRVQSDWDRKKQEQSKITAELRDLFRSSREMLCELETAYNNTHPFRKQKLIEIKRDQMDKRLKLRTKEDIKSKKSEEPNGVDLLFVKHYYYEFLKTMFNVLAQKTRRRGQINIVKPNKDFKGRERKFGSITMSSNGNMSGNNKNNKNNLKNRNKRRHLTS